MVNADAFSMVAGLSKRLINELRVAHQQGVDVRGLETEQRRTPDDLRRTVVSAHHVERNGGCALGHLGEDLTLPRAAGGYCVPLTWRLAVLRSTQPLVRVYS